MKIVYSVLLIGLSLLMGFLQAIIIIHFKLNRDAIEQRYCINKNKPELQCHGTCHLKKELEETKHGGSLWLDEYKSIDVAFISTFEFDAKMSISIEQKKIFISKNILYQGPGIETAVPPPKFYL